MNIKVEGVDEAMRKLDLVPENALKMTESAMKDAARPVVKKIRSGVPKEFRKLIKSKLVSGKNRTNGQSIIIIGAFKGKKNDDKDVPQWFKMYWKNYGTLTRRDTSHEFVYPVKRGVKNRRNNVGQSHENFFDAAIQGWDQVMLSEFQNALKKRENELVK